VKLSSAELVSMAVFLGIFLGILAVYFSFFRNFFRPQQRAIARLKSLAGKAPDAEGNFADWLRSTLPKIGTVIMPKEEDHRLLELKANFLRAGIYNPKAMRIYLGAKLVLMLVLPIPFAVAPYGLGLVSLFNALALSLIASCTGMSLPAFWLRGRVATRQQSLRRAIPDALDMLVLCLEGGVSLMAGLYRVMEELQAIHPPLAGELNIIHGEIQLGLTVGEALRAFGERCDLEEVRELASVLLQSERIGASTAQALRTHADDSRHERHQLAEEVAQKTPVKILLPTLLCIFPAIFIVLIGPAAIHMAELFK
jgi:tight adherence protein C